MKKKPKKIRQSKMGMMAKIMIPVVCMLLIAVFSVAGLKVVSNNLYRQGMRISSEIVTCVDVCGDLDTDYTKISSFASSVLDKPDVTTGEGYRSGMDEAYERMTENIAIFEKKAQSKEEVQLLDDLEQKLEKRYAFLSAQIDQVLYGMEIPEDLVEAEKFNAPIMGDIYQLQQLTQEDMKESQQTLKTAKRFTDFATVGSIVIISAMFVVVYKANEVTAKYMRELEKDGLTIFFRTSDANITEEFIENEFGLPSDVVKIINPVAGEMFQKVKNRVSERTNANIIHDGTVKTMLSALHAAFGINNFVNVTRIVQLAEAVIGAAVVVLLAFLSGLAQVGVWQIIIYQALWTLILSLLPTLRKK